MENKHKNILIGSLVAVVLVMVVGYAAFAQQLTINGTAEITSNWDVHFDTTYNTDITPVAGNLVGGTQSSTDPSGSITELENLTATLHADLVQPGDSVTFVLHVKNYGTGLYAKAVSSSPVLSSSTEGTNCVNNTTPKTCTIDHIKWSVTATRNELAPSVSNSIDTVTVVAEYTDDVVTNEDLSAKADESSLTVTLNYEQVNHTS